MDFIQKPVRGWLHDDEVIRSEGVVYIVRYVGCVDVHASMKLLDFDTRFLIAKECINKVCGAAGLKSGEGRRKTDKRVVRAIGNTVNMDFAGVNVKLIISAKSISLKTLDGNHPISSHDMPKISFASGGDSDTLDFVAFVAKDIKDKRACYVLECGRGMAQDVITSIGQAFELRFKDYLCGPEGISKTFLSSQENDREYYNDLPGKVPPDVAPATALFSYNGAGAGPRTGKSGKAPRERIPSTNLIDLNSELPPPLHQTHDYVNDMVFNPAAMPRDVFDMNPIEANLPPAEVQLHNEEWFHGVIDRAYAESLLKNDGDFLVRESGSSPGQYILTGLQGGTKKHLLLIDPEGMVRTKDRMFESVSHLINYHCNNQLPIISAESALVLRNPVTRRV